MVGGPVKRLVKLLFLFARMAAGAAALNNLSRAVGPLPPISSPIRRDRRAPGAGPLSRVRPTVGRSAGSTLSAPRPQITVVVPARNEAERIGPCLDLVCHDPAVAEVIVVDDHSTDGTADIARAAGARVVVAGPLPTGWAGKCWAVQQGVLAASTEWVVALDADTEPSIGLATALVDRSITDGWDLLTVSGRFRCPAPALQALHPSLLTTLVYRYGPPGSSRPTSDVRSLANGQCMTFRREVFLNAGGFKPVADSLVEDVALARQWSAAGRRVGFLDASGLLTVAMHTDAADAWRGWGRSLPLGGVAGRREQAEGLVVVWLAQALPLLRLVLGIADTVDAVLLMARLGTLFGTRRAYEKPSAAFWLSPLADVPVAARLTQSTLRPERTWRGRTYR